MTQRTYEELFEFKGYKYGLHDAYTLGKIIGQGGWGVVRRGKRKSDDFPVAIKILPKVAYTGANQSVKGKQSKYIQSIKDEIEIMLALRGSLGVVYLHEVYQDEDNVYLVMELCTGGPLLKSEGMGKGRKLSEQIVSRYIKDILQLLVICHARHIVHRDVKPGNFMLLHNRANSPVKVIDFGLSKYFVPSELPLKASTAEGTPWYLAPEACRGKWYPQTDVWAVCVMAFYMLTGSYPFIDRTNPMMPDMAKTLKAICFHELDLTSKECAHLSPLAVDFLKFGLNEKDIDKRPTAKDCLRHPWIQQGEILDKKPLNPTVLQRLQKFSQNGAFKCTVLEHMAREIVSRHFAAENGSQHHVPAFKERSVKHGHEFQVQHTDLPKSTLYSRSLARMFDQIQTDKDGRIGKDALYKLLVELGHGIGQDEATEIFNALDGDKKGYLEEEDIAAGLVDWQDYRDTFKDRWIESARKVFDDLDNNNDGTLTAEEISRAFEGDVSVLEVDAAVHNVLVEVAARHKRTTANSLTFDDFVDFISSENGISSSLFPDRLDRMEEEEDQKVGSGWFCLCS